MNVIFQSGLLSFFLNRRWRLEKIPIPPFFELLQINKSTQVYIIEERQTSHYRKTGNTWHLININGLLLISQAVINATIIYVYHEPKNCLIIMMTSLNVE